MGYYTSQKGYLLMDLDTKKLFIKKDIMFQEHVFKFSKKQSEGDAANFLQLCEDYNSETDSDMPGDSVFSSPVNAEKLHQNRLVLDYMIEVSPHE